MKYISNKYCIWEDEKGKRYKLKKIALLMESGKKFVEQRHYVRSLYRQNIKPNAVIIYKDVIIDGTHRMLASILRGDNIKILAVIGPIKL